MSVKGVTFSDIHNVNSKHSNSRIWKKCCTMFGYVAQRFTTLYNVVGGIFALPKNVVQRCGMLRPVGPSVGTLFAT